MKNNTRRFLSAALAICLGLCCLPVAKGIDSGEAARFSTYYDLLMDIFVNPNDYVYDVDSLWEGYTREEKLAAQDFAICDVTGDGADDLILQFRGVPTSNNLGYVYSIIGGVVRCVYMDAGIYSYYGSGYAIREETRIQGYLHPVYPYTVSRYDPAKLSFVDLFFSYSVERGVTYGAWDDAADTDGDGIVFYVVERDSLSGEIPMTYNEYIDYLAKYGLTISWEPCDPEAYWDITGDSMIKPDYHSLTRSNVEMYAKTLPRTLDFGDVDGDGEVTAQDARYALRFAIDLDSYTESQKSAADADGDNEITAQDARTILRAAIGLGI